MILVPMTTMKGEHAMKKIFFALYLAAGCSLAVAQGRQNDAEPKKAPVPQENIPNQVTAPLPKPPAVPQSAAPEDFIIGPEDVLAITVWREPDLSIKSVVRPDGKIGVTLLGDVQASGLTTGQLRAEI